MMMLMKCGYITVRWLHRRESMQKLIAELKEKLAVTTHESLSAEERSKMVESVMQTEEKRQEQLHTEIAQMSTLRFRRGNELHEVKLEKRHVDTEIQVGLIQVALSHTDTGRSNTGSSITH